MRNAFEAMREAGKEPRQLTIRTAMRDAENVLVAVHDTGIGFSPETHRQLFDRFFTTKADGMGMGLPISQSIIENHGGSLWAEPNPDRGATFFFTLPIDYGDQHRG
jgi:signal transduction histidine kinase